MATQREITVLAVCSLFLLVTPLFVLLRFRSRTLTGVRILLEDWFLLASLVLNTAFCIILIVAVTAGNIGSHGQLGSNGLPIITERHKVGFLCIDIAHPLTLIVEGLTKVSLLLLYRRIFIFRWFRILDTIAIAIVVAWTLGFTFAKIFECQNIAAFWISPLSDEGPKAGCVDFISEYQADAITDLLTDAMILFMPIPCIWKLRLPWRRRVGVTLIFMLGSFVLATNAIRLYEFAGVNAGVNAAKKVPTSPPDESYLYAVPFLWSVIQTSVGIICASLPTIAPLFDGSIKGSIAYYWPRSLSLSWRSNRNQSKEGRHSVNGDDADKCHGNDHGKSEKNHFRDRRWDQVEVSA